MAVNKRLISGAAAAPGGITPSEHFGVVLYEGDGASSHSINGGKFGAAAYTANSGVVTLPDNIIDVDNHSVSIWFYANNLTGEQHLMEFDETNRIIFRISSPNNNDWCYVGNSGYFDHGLRFNTGQWYHIVITFSNGNPFKIYRNGSLEYTGGNTSLYANNSNNDVGAGNSTGGVCVEGKIDQLRIFHKELSASEVSTLYAETVDTVTSLDPLSEDTTDTLQVLGDSSCIATYRFENNEDDLSGNYNGTGTSVQYAAGRYGQAASFNGSDSYISTTLDLKDLSSVSISFWAYWQSGIDGAVIGGDSSDGASGYKSNKNTVKLTYSSNRFDYISYGGDLYRHTTSLSDGWHHFAISDNGGTGNTSATMYVDGASVSYSIIVDGGSYSNHENMQIGRSRKNDGTIGNYYDNKLDQIRIFNKVISASEVTTLYEENSLVASYRFEGNANDDTRTYNGTATNVTYEYGLNFTPDFVWIKDRGNAEQHILNDSTRGATKDLSTNTTAAEATRTTGFLSFDTGGFTLGSDGGGVVNDPTRGPYVAWCLKANGGTTSSNTDGDITSTVQVNSDAGFSIVKWASSNYSQTIGHGLDSAPDLIIAKELDTTRNWLVYSSALGNDYYLQLNVTNAAATPNAGRLEVSGTDKFICGTDGTNQIAYCFKNIDGFSKFGSYVGTGDADDRPIIETGFEPAFVMIKSSSTGGTTPYHWNIYDNKRNKTNPRNLILEADTSDADLTASTTYIDFLSNGFQIGPATSGRNNGSGVTYIYMAFAADPDTEAPTLAKSFNVQAYDGTATSQTIANGFKTGLLFAKCRNVAHHWGVHDIVRGVGKWLISNGSDADQSGSYGIEEFGENSTTLYGNFSPTNSDYLSGEYVGYFWKADDNEPTLFGGPAKAVYKFEDNGNDVTGNNNATATSITYGTGKFNKGAIFNGTTSNFKTGSSFTGTNGGSFTLSCWVKIDDITGVENLLLGRFSYTTSDKQFILRVLNGGAVRLNVYNSSGTGESITTTDTLSIDTWYHIVAVVDGTKKSLYIDGELSVSETGSISSNSSATGFLEIGGAGHLPASDAGRLDGMLDQVRIYNGAVSDIGAAALYAETVSDNDDLTLGGPPETIISANANAGFSIVKFDGDGSVQKIQHGLSAAPEMIIFKNLDSTGDWQVYHTSVGNDKKVSLNSTAAASSTSRFDNTSPTASVFTFNSSSYTGNIIAYCFHSVSGYSAFGYWQGGTTTITIGFRADFVLYQDFGAGGSWTMVDSVRGDDVKVLANSSDAESSQSLLTITDTGFTVTSESAIVKRLYMAFKIN